MDGVTVPCHPPYRPASGDFCVGPDGEKFYTVWEKCVDVLNQIGDEFPEIVFVLNSTWKAHGDRAQNKLEEKGFRFQLVGATPAESGEYVRSSAIRDWFIENEINQDEVLWVAVDDEFFSYSPKDRGRHLLHINPYVGLFKGNVLGFKNLISEQQKET